MDKPLCDKIIFYTKSRIKRTSEPKFSDLPSCEKVFQSIVPSNKVIN